MKSLSIILALLLFSSFAAVKEPVLIHRFIVQPSSTLAIDGSTNVNSFQCAISSYIGTDTLILQEGKAPQRPVFLRGRVALKASYFDCGMSVMTKDFNHTIKSKEYPHIIIDFKSFERAPDYTREVEKFRGTMNISLGGTTKQFIVDCTIKPQSSGLIHLSGARTFLFSDFNLQPPEKMLGLIRLQQELTVRFNLVLLLDKNS